MNQAAVLTVDSLRYSFRRKQVLQGISFEANEGVLGILGPNGAGKSTLMSIISTLRTPSAGTVSWFEGKCPSVDTIRECIGYLPQAFRLVRSMRVLETVAYSAWVHGVARNDCEDAALRALHALDIADLQATRSGRLSGGQKQRVALACAIAHAPRLLLLDEPTVGLDPIIRMDFRKAMTRLGEQACVIVTTHLTDDIEHGCDRTLVIDQGTVIFDGSPRELADRGRNAAGSGTGSLLENGYEHVLVEARG